MNIRIRLALFLGQRIGHVPCPRIITGIESFLHLGQADNRLLILYLPLEPVIAEAIGDLRHLINQGQCRFDITALDLRLCGEQGHLSLQRHHPWRLPVELLQHQPRLIQIAALQGNRGGAEIGILSSAPVKRPLEPAPGGAGIATLQRRIAEPDCRAGLGRGHRRRSGRTQATIGQGIGKTAHREMLAKHRQILHITLTTDRILPFQFQQHAGGGQ